MAALEWVREQEHHARAVEARNHLHVGAALGQRDAAPHRVDQREVGAGYFDQVLQAITGGTASTLALSGSTEEAQFETAIPRNAPATGSLVRIARPRVYTCGTKYGPMACTGTRLATVGPQLA